ncbi:MAG TPA: adenosine deaminase [Candidatus Krumholzibacteria bacterium]|nr:adenosine deaminase [Candidatus Krumholzibacteria bacterium]HPD72306.1 adenosine deaminase [Candidatus Krumholzibacteria bacterium]HRY40762.1 adenosine deaminase [Candidatus Krumholzibacteria bacterium]
MNRDDRRRFLRSLPLAELHRHFDGACRPATLWEYSEQYYRAVPGLDFEEFRHYLQWDDAKDRNLLDYLSKFDVPLQYTQFYENIKRIAYEIAADAYAEGIRVLELRTNPIIHRRAGLSTRQVVHATRKGLARFGEEHPDFRAGINIIAMRNHGGNLARILLREVIGEKAEWHGGPGVIGFDIAGAEAPFPPILFVKAYELAAKMGLGLTVHAGEAAGPERVWEAVENLGPRRIGHGTSAGRDPELLKRLAADGIVVECCLTSNVHTGAIDRYLDHPLPKFLDAGVRVALCTDNPTVSNTDLVREYEIAMTTFGFSENDMRRIARQGWEGSFVAEAGTFPAGGER